jgi:enolase
MICGSCLQVVIGMDVAASEFYDHESKLYDLNFKEEVSSLPLQISNLYYHGRFEGNVWRGYLSDGI